MISVLYRFFVLAGLWAASLSCLAAGKPLTIAFVPQNTSVEFAQSLHAGAVKAQQELVAQGFIVKLLWKGPLRESDSAAQISLMDNFSARRVDGLVIDPVDSGALVESVEFATSAGVPVVVVNSAVQTEKIASFIGTDQFRAGQKAGEYLGRLMNGAGNALMLRGAAGSSSTGQREAGFVSAMTNQFPAIKLLANAQRSGGTLESAVTAAKQLTAEFGEKVNGVFTPNEQTTVAMLRALREAQRAGGIVKLVGFDAAQEAVGALEKGDLQALMVQDAVKLGYTAITTVVTASQHGKVAPKIGSEFVLITKELSVDPANKNLLHPAIADFLK